LAIASVVFGLFCLPGPIAVIIGWFAVRAINRSDGRLRGSALAFTGIALGGAGTVLVALGSVAMVLQLLKEKSNRVECLNNLGRIGVAVNVDADQEGHTFPPAVVPLAGHPPDEHLSWLAGLLPLLDQKPNPKSPLTTLAAQLDLRRPWDDAANLPAVRTNVRAFRCPSHGLVAEPGHPALTDYIGIAGVGENAASLPVTDAAAGFFGYERSIGLKDLRAGASWTLIAAETPLDNGPWAAGGRPTVRGLGAEEVNFIGPGREFGGCHRDGATDLLMAAYADGSARIVTSAINPKVFRNSARLAGDPGAN
jgi:hypothetical protein